jgi:hypothetical protein
VNCREAERLIDTFYDGELDGRSMRDAAMHITRCKRCEAELGQRERVQELLSRTIEHEIADIDLSQIWAAVEPTLEQVTARPSGLRVAAASSRVGGLLLGRKSAADVADDGFDPATWDSPAPRHRAWRWSVAGGAALAASVLLALALTPQLGENPQGGVRVAAEKPAVASSTTTEVARGPSPATVVAQRAPVGAESFDVARAGIGRGVRPASNKQVQVESVNFPRSAVSMWSEPASDTTVIWIDDEELAASGRR